MNKGRIKGHSYMHYYSFNTVLPEFIEKQFITFEATDSTVVILFSASRRLPRIQREANSTSV